MICFKRVALISTVLYVGFTVACLHRTRSFLIVPQPASYVLRAPNAHETPFPDILRNYNGYQPGKGWMDIRPLMDMRIENAYYENGATRGGLEGFLGTEVATYGMTAHGLELLSVRSMSNRPPADLPVQDLISRAQSTHRFYRLY